MHELKANSMESSVDLVTLVYQMAFQHGPDPVGLRHYSRLIDWGMTPIEFMQEIEASEEFQVTRKKLLAGENWDRLAFSGAKIIMPLKDGVRLCAPAKNQLLFQELLNLGGISRPHIIEIIKEYLYEGNTFIDVGAGVGYFTILASQIVGSTGSVLSFEPFPENFRYLQENIRLNDLKNVKAFQNGLWDSNIKRGILETAPNIARIVEGNDVEMIALDSINVRPDMVKMHIEGSEVFALRGMARTLEKYKPIVLLKFNPVSIVVAGGTITDFWRQLEGYKVYKIPGKEVLKSFAQLRRICPDHAVVNLLALP